jgi:hypothetical protein
MVCENVDWIYLAPDRDPWQAFLNPLTYSLVP